MAGSSSLPPTSSSSRRMSAAAASFFSSSSLLLATCLVLTTAFFAPVTSAADISPMGYQYQRRVLPDVNFYWRIDSSSSPGTFYAAVEVFGSSSPPGWIGFGIGEPTSGSMPGADMMIAQYLTSASEDNMTVGDYYATGFSTPVLDCASSSTSNQDWTKVAISRNATGTVVEFSRRLDTGDSTVDRPIVNNGQGTRMLFAYGQTSRMSYHGAVNRKFYHTDLFNPVAHDQLAPIKARADVSIFRMAMRNYTIPGKKTTYKNTECFIPPPVETGTGRRPFILAIESDIVAENLRYVHHITVSGYDNDQCRGIGSMIYAVASRHNPLVFSYSLPNGTHFDGGIDLSTFQRYRLQMHYDNPQLSSGVVDNSGVKLYFSYSPVVNEIGMLEVGDPVVALIGTQIPAGNQESYNSFTCGSQCTQRLTGEITILADLLHMHQVGSFMETQFISSTGQTYATRKAEYYSFHLQENLLFENPIVVRPGDSMSTVCGYKTQSQVKFGPDSDDEMCIHFLYFYPASAARDLGSRCGALFCGSIDATTARPSRQFGASSSCDGSGTEEGTGTANAASPFSLSALSATLVTFVLLVM